MNPEIVFLMKVQDGGHRRVEFYRKQQCASAAKITSRVRFRFMRKHIVDNSSVFPEVWELEMFPTAKVIFIVTPCH